MKNPREQLAEAEVRLTGLRTELRRAKQVQGVAKSAYAEAGSDASLDAAKSASEAVGTVEGEIERVTEAQTAALRSIGDLEAGRAGFTSLGGDPWASAARALDLGRGQLRHDTAAVALLTPSTFPSLPTTPTDGTPTTQARSNRYLFPTIPSQPFGDAGSMVTTDFTVSFGQDPVSGVERPVDATSQKAELVATVGLATPSALEYAVLLKAIPARLFDSQQALRSLLSQQGGKLLADVYDKAVIATIEGAAPPVGGTGTDLVSKIRTAIAAHRDLGAEPSVLALSSSDAASLDLAKDGAGHYIFTTRITGSGSPVWTLIVREADVSAPTLIDPLKVGVNFYGDASVVTDPYGDNLSTNQVSIRLEVEARFHLRDLRGAFVIA